MAAVPDVGRATGVEQRVAPEAAATQDLYERYAGQIFSFCLHKLGNREEAEDAVQQTFLNAFRGLRRGIDVETESAWLFKIAHNVCLTRQRSSWRRGKVETPNDMEALQDFVAAPQRMGSDDLIQLQDALAAMPATQRKAILLREWQGLSYHEIAEEMELSQPAVETLIFRARRTLAQGLEQAPAESRGWRRLRHTMDVGSALTAVKALLMGGAAAKVAVTTAALTAVAVVPAGIEQNRVPPSRTASAQPVVAPKQTAPAPLARMTQLAPVPVVSESPARQPAPPPRPAQRAAAKPKAAAAPNALPVPSTPAPTAEPPADPAAAAEAPVAAAPPPAEPKAEQPTAEEPKAEPPKPKPQRPKAEEPAAAPAPVAPVPEDRPGKGRDKAKAKDHGQGNDRAPQAVEEVPAEPQAAEHAVEQAAPEQPQAEQPHEDDGKPDKPEKDDGGPKK